MKSHNNIYNLESNNSMNTTHTHTHKIAISDAETRLRNKEGHRDRHTLRFKQFKIIIILNHFNYFKLFQLNDLFKLLFK